MKAGLKSEAQAEREEVRVKGEDGGADGVVKVARMKQRQESSRLSNFQKAE